MSGYTDPSDGSAHHDASPDSQNSSWQTEPEAYQGVWRHQNNPQEPPFAPHDHQVSYDSHYHADPARLGGDMLYGQFAPHYHQVRVHASRT